MAEFSDGVKETVAGPRIKSLTSELESGRSCQLKEQLDLMPALEERMKVLRAIVAQNKEDRSAEGAQAVVPKLTLREQENTYFVNLRLTANDGPVMEGETLYEETLNWQNLDRHSQCKKD